MKIIDVSHHNGKINWQSVSTEADCVFIKATEGSSYVDPMAAKNAIAATQQGFKVGYYHFATLNSHNVETDAKNEANWFVATLQVLPKETLPLVLDIETNKIGISKPDVLLYIQTFFRQLVLHGYHDYILYSYTSFLNDNLPKNHPLGVIKLWLADYDEPFVVPKGWDSIYLHQHTDKGTVAGIKGNVDLNVYVGDKNAIS